MDVLLTPFGRAGDVYPLIGIGSELQRRGHRITMITNAYFEDLSRRAGFEFVPFSTREDYFSLIDNPDLWHPQKAVPLLAETSVIPAIPVIYRLIEERYRPGETVVVAGSLALGARVAEEKLGVPLTEIHLQPAVCRRRSSSWCSPTTSSASCWAFHGRRPCWATWFRRRSSSRPYDDPGPPARMTWRAGRRIGHISVLTG